MHHPFDRLATNTSGADSDINARVGGMENQMEVTTVKGVISVTFAVDVSERQHLLGLSPHDLLQLSKEKLATIIPSSRIRHAAVDYNGGDTMLVILSI